MRLAVACHNLLPDGATDGSADTVAIAVSAQGCADALAETRAALLAKAHDKVKEAIHTLDECASSLDKDRVASFAKGATQHFHA